MSAILITVQNVVNDVLVDLNIIFRLISSLGFMFYLLELMERSIRLFRVVPIGPI